MKTKTKTTWRKVKLGEVLEITSSKRIFMSEYKTSGVPFYRGKEIIEKYNRAKEISTPLYISEEKFFGIKNKFGAPGENDILLSSVGTLGIPYLVEKDEKFYFKDGNLTWFRNYSNNVNPKFIYYWLTSPLGKHSVLASSIGSSQQALTIDGLKKIEINLPSLTEQKRIAEILSAFDDKIELNNKISQNLEQMAQAIFKEWFVKFRFPGYKKAKSRSERSSATGMKMVDSELGKIPEGWKVGYLGDGFCSEIIKTGINKFQEQRVYLATADVNRNEIINTKTLITYDGRPSRANMELVLNSIWFAKMINTYKVLFFFKGNQENIQEFILSTGFFGIKALNDFQYYLYLSINSERFHKIKDTLVQGAVQEAVTVENIKSVKLVLPPKNILPEFNNKVEPFLMNIYKVKKENQALSSLRDLLLPKLMSGEIRI